MYILLTQGKNLSFGSFFALAALTALLIGWPGRGPKEPMMQAVVVPEMRSSAYSVVSLVEGGHSAFAGVIAGGLADRIGLTNALVWTIPFPWIICGIFFTAFYFTYPKDAAQVRHHLKLRRDELILAHEEIP